MRRGEGAEAAREAALGEGRTRAAAGGARGSHLATRAMICSTAACSLSKAPAEPKRSRVVRTKSMVTSRNSVEYCRLAAPRWPRTGSAVYRRSAASSASERRPSNCACMRCTHSPRGTPSRLPARAREGRAGRAWRDPTVSMCACDGGGGCGCGSCAVPRARLRSRAGTANLSSLLSLKKPLPPLPPCPPCPPSEQRSPSGPASASSNAAHAVGPTTTSPWPAMPSAAAISSSGGPATTNSRRWPMPTSTPEPLPAPSPRCSRSVVSKPPCAQSGGGAGSAARGRKRADAEGARTSRAGGRRCARLVVVERAQLLERAGGGSAGELLEALAAAARPH